MEKSLGIQFLPLTAPSSLYRGETPREVGGQGRGQPAASSPQQNPAFWQCLPTPTLRFLQASHCAPHPGPPSRPLEGTRPPTLSCLGLSRHRDKGAAPQCVSLVAGPGCSRCSPGPAGRASPPNLRGSHRQGATRHGCCHDSWETLPLRSGPRIPRWCGVGLGLGTHRLRRARPGSVPRLDPAAALGLRPAQGSRCWGGRRPLGKVGERHPLSRAPAASPSESQTAGASYRGAGVGEDAATPSPTPPPAAPGGERRAGALAAGA